MDLIRPPSSYLLIYVHLVICLYVLSEWEKFKDNKVSDIYLFRVKITSCFFNFTWCLNQIIKSAYYICNIMDDVVLLLSGPIRGGLASTSVWRPERQEEACESLKALIALATEVVFLKTFSSFFVCLVLSTIISLFRKNNYVKFT